MAEGAIKMPPGRGRTGTDLRHHHPVSFVYDANLATRRGELRMPSALPRNIRLDKAGQMQCTSCHDPHDDGFKNFLVMPNSNSGLCVECHLKDGWSTSAHGQSDAEWNGQGRNPWPRGVETTVSGNACRNCHEMHQPGGGRVLTRHEAEDEYCSACHNGNVATKDVSATFELFSAHPVSDNTLSHDGAEPAVVQDRHVECSDCHNPHEPAAQGSSAPGPRSSPRRAPPVRGVGLGNAEVRRASRGYEVCLRCHGDSPGKRTPRVRRQLDQDNVRMEIQQGNPSFHPIAGPGRNQDVPSLIDPLTPQSIMDCVDCHNSDVAVGGGASGPHGSSFEPILAMNYTTTDNTPESPSAYALCYSCHSRDSILNDESFAEHDKHISGEETPCSICHDAHGVSAVQGNPMNNTHLINFDTTVVEPNSQGILRFDDQGRYSGSCDLLCHEKDHQAEIY
jgi:predicted CXXCH cytochrome family protein